MLSRGAWQKPARLSEGFSEKQEGHHDGGLPRQDSGRHGSGIPGKKRRFRGEWGPFKVAFSELIAQKLAICNALCQVPVIFRGIYRAFLSYLRYRSWAKGDSRIPFSRA